MRVTPKLPSHSHFNRHGTVMGLDQTGKCNIAMDGGYLLANEQFSDWTTPETLTGDTITVEIKHASDV